MVLRDTRSDGLVLRCIMGACCIYSMWHNMTHHYDSLRPLHFTWSWHYGTLQMLMSLPVTLFTHVCSSVSVCVCVCVCFYDGLISDSILRDHIMLHLYLSVLWTQPQFKMSLLCRIKAGSCTMFSQRLLFSCALCSTAYKPFGPLFKYGERINVCSPLLCFIENKQSKTWSLSNSLHPDTPVSCKEIL